MNTFEDEATKHWMIFIGLIVLAVLFFGLYITGWLRPGFGIDPPKDLTAQQTDHQVHLMWESSLSPRVIGYNVYRSTDRSSWVKVNPEPITETEYYDTSLTEEGDYYYLIKSVDSSGHESKESKITHVYFDLTPPSITKFVIGDNISATNDPDIIIQLISPDAYMCRFSEDGVWSDWMTYQSLIEYHLNSTVDGLKKVGVQCKDRFDNVGSPLLRTIYLDRESPRVNIISPDPEEIYFSGGIPLVFGVNEDYKQTISCKVLMDGRVVLLDSVEYDGTDSVYSGQLSADPGDHTLIIRCYDEAGNIGVDSIVFHVVSEERSSHKYYRLEINDGDRKTYDRDVKLSVIPKEDITITRCRFRNENESWSNWTTKTDRVDWMLSEGYGEKKVYSECYSGNRSLGVEFDEIIYKKRSERNNGPHLPEIISFWVNDDTGYTNEYTIRLHIDARCAEECRFAEKYGMYTRRSKWESYVNERDWHLYEGEGTHELKVECRNQLGTDSKTTSVIVDLTPPQAPNILVNLATEGRISIQAQQDVDNDVHHFNIYRKIVSTPRKRVPGHHDSTVGHWVLIGIAERNQYGFGTYIDEHTSEGMEYMYRVTAVDLAGNEGEPSEEVGPIEPDFNPPTVTIERPRDGSRTDGDITLGYRFEDDVSDAVECEHYVDGEYYSRTEDWIDVDEEGTYVDIHISQRIFDRQHTIEVRCYDRAGNMGSDEITVIVEGLGGGTGGPESSEISEIEEPSPPAS